MPKFDSTQYAALWSNEGRAIQSLILNDPNRIPQYYTFWREKFTVDPVTTPTNPDGSASFISRMRRLETGVLMDMRAPLADGTPMEKGNASQYTSIIPDFIAKTYLETAMEREYKERLFEQVGEDNASLAGYVVDFLQSAVNSANMTLSHMAAQLLSTGKVNYKQGEGIQAGISKADIPTENFLNAGGVVWSDTTNFKFLDWGRDIVERLNNKYGVDMAWQLEIPKDIWLNYIVKNAQVIEQIRFINNINGILLPSTAQMTEDMAMNAIRKWEGMPNIVIVEEKQKDITNGVVSGWAQNTVVVRPAGFAGVIRHTTNLDSMLSKYQNNLISAVYTPALGGLLTIENAVVPNGIYKEWHAKAMMQAIPSLDEFLYHYIIKTNVAGDAYNF
jgi:hypothetical protein